MEIPKHIGIIVDGNGRWAKSKGKIRSFGHKEGMNNLDKIQSYCQKIGVKNLSFYIFSTDNFKRDKKEVDYLMNLFCQYFTNNESKIIKSNIKIIFSGRDEPLSKKVISIRNKIQQSTMNNTGLVVNFCLNYGAQEEIIDGFKKVYTDILNNKFDVENLNKITFNKYLYNDLPSIDLLIRTSGEQRLSNFMLWQSSYAELYFPNTFFPDFKEKDLDEAILVYNKRDRRFGGIKDEN